MLFSSVNQIWVLLLFIYLGLVSGIIFFLICFLTNKLKCFLLLNKLQKPKNEMANAGEEKEENPKNKTANTVKKKEKKLNNKPKKISKFFLSLKNFFSKNSQQEDNKNPHKISKNKPKKIKTKNAENGLKPNKTQLITTLNKALNQLKKFKKIVVNVFCTLIKILSLFLVIVVSYLINLQLNFGYLNLWFIIVFLASFFVAKSLLKLVAIYFLNFYNYFINKFKRCGKQL